MAGKRSPWRALRPVFLAGAATLTWLTLSASAASADPLQDATSLLGGATTSVASVAEELPVSTASLAEAVPPISAPAPAPDSSLGLLQPLAGEVPGLADQIVASVPVVNDVIPADTVSVITVPVAESLDVATAEAVDALVPPVTEVLPVLEPVLQPVVDVAAGTLLLPELPVTAPVEEVLAGAPTPVASPEVAVNGAFDVPEQSAASADPLAAAAVSLPPQAVLLPGFTEEQPGTAHPSTAPAKAPPGPGSGTGGSASSAASSGAAAWLSPFDLNLPSAGMVLAGEIPEHAPAPVSFDPGSSPD